MGIRDDWVPPGVPEALVQVCQKFIKDHKITCQEQTTDDRIYVNAPELVFEMCELLGYFVDPDE